MNFAKRALYALPIVLLFILATVFTAGSLYGLTTTRAYEHRFYLWLILFVGIGFYITTTIRWRQLRTYEASDVSELIRLVEQLRRQGITQVNMVNDGDKEKVTIQRESTIMGFDYTVTVVKTDQYFTDSRNAEIIETQRYRFSKQQQGVDRTVTYVNVPKPNTKRSLPGEELDDTIVEIPDRKQYERTFQRATPPEVIELIGSLRRAAQWSGTTLDG